MEIMDIVHTTHMVAVECECMEWVETGITAQPATPHQCLKKTGMSSN
jgi:hypothetical protein